MTAMLFMLGVISFNIIAVDIATSSVAEARVLTKGEPVCGGVLNGKLQPGCNDFKAAAYKGKARADCPAGSFFDIGTWSCWTCPPGYNRSAAAVTEHNACSKAVPPRPTRAKFHYRTGCPAGTFFDPRRGGECWSCPAGTKRTLAAVSEWNACSKGVFAKPVRATYHGKSRSCGGGTFLDPRNGGECWSCPSGTVRTIAPVTAANACQTPAHEALSVATLKAHVTCAPGQVFDFIRGGSCWSCPPMYSRSVFPVDSPKACQNTQLIWKMPTRSKYRGLFDVPGAEGIARDILTKPEAVEAIFKRMAKGARTTSEKIHDAFDEEMKSPETSPMLGTLVFLDAIDAIESGKMTRDQRMFYSALNNYMSETRIILAQEALNQYDNWLAAKKMHEAQRAKTGGNIEALTNMGYVPPDFSGYAAELLGASGATAGLAAGVAMMTGTVMTTTGETIPLLEGLQTISSSLARSLLPNIMEVDVVAAEAAVEASTIATTAGEEAMATAAASTASQIAAVAGPMIVVAVATIIATIALDHVIKAVKARPALVAALNKAKQPLNLPAMLKESGGFNEALGNFTSMIAGKPARNSPAFMKFLADLKAGRTSGTTGNSHVVVKKGTVEYSGTIPVTDVGGDTSGGSSSGGAGGAGASANASSGTFKLALSSNSDLCLGVRGGRPASQRRVSLVKCTSAEALDWTPGRNSDFITGGHFCLDVMRARNADMTPLWLYQCNKSPAQQWTFDEKGHGSMVSRIGNRCADVGGGRLVAGAPLQIYRCNGTAAQSFGKR